MSLTEKIKQKALQIGFSKVGIARAEKLQKEANNLQEWLSRKYHGKMEWMEKNFEKRIDPNELFKGAKSVISLAINYNTNFKHSKNPETAKISRYAWGDDYHHILKNKLYQLLDFIKNEDKNVDGKVCVDTSPIMDKVWAVKSGIGWLGKHSNVITRDYGSFVFLGEIILNIELEYDKEIGDFCGTCSKCISACPTGAIVEPQVVDSNRCISYLTIELREEKIPKEFHNKMEGFIFGCDICQDVCPWNVKFSKITNEISFEPREGNLNSKLSELVKMSKEDFQKQFKNSSVKRTRYEGFIRNVFTVLKNLLLLSILSLAF